VNNRELRSKTASQNPKLATFCKRAVRLDLWKKAVFTLMAAMLLFAPATPVTAATYPEVLSDYIDVNFELIEETPVSLTFEVMVANELGYELEGLPLEILVDGAPVETITLTEHKKVGYKVKQPVYSEVEQSYTSKYGIYELGDASKDELSANTFADYDKDGNIIYEGAYESYDKASSTWYWTETEQTGEKTVDKVDEVKVKTKVKEKDKKPEKVMLELPSKDDAKSGYGPGTLYYTVTIDTGLLKSSEGWGSAGVMTWRIAGYDYKDLENSSWWETNWEYKRRLTIDATSIAEDLEEFPVTVQLDGAFNYDHCQLDGDDFRFVDADDNNLAYEIDLSSDFTDTAIFYVNVPEIVGGTDDGYIDMYYGNPTASSGENINGTWNDGYVFVSHMNDNPLDSTQILDSTSNANHGTKGVGAATPTEVDGLVGKAQSSDGGDYISLGAGNLITTSDYTFEILCLLEDTGATRALLGFRSDGTGYGTEWYVRDAGHMFSRHYDPVSVNCDLQSTDGDIIDGNYYSLAMVRERGQNGLFYIDGSEPVYVTQIVTTAGDISNAGDKRIGSRSNSTLLFKGKNSETRISSTARGAGWISFTNSDLRNEILTVGSETWADVPQAPTDLTYTTDGNNVILDWARGLRADTTVIVRGENGYPMTPTDGEVVYDGAGTTVTDSGVNSEFRPLYYRAWSYNDWGYSIEYAEAEKGVLMTELFMVLGLTAFALWRREIWVYLPAVIALIFFGYRWIDTDIMFGLPFFALALFMTIKMGWSTIQKARS